MGKNTRPRTSTNSARYSQKKDNEKILTLQNEYFALRSAEKHKNSNTETQLIKSMQNCAKKFIYYEQVRKGFFISPEDVEIKSLEAVAYIMIQYNKRPDFKLGTPSAYIRLRVLAELYRHKKIEEFVTYTDHVIEG